MRHARRQVAALTTTHVLLLAQIKALQIIVIATYIDDSAFKWSVNKISKFFHYNPPSANSQFCVTLGTEVLKLVVGVNLCKSLITVILVLD